MRARYEVLVYHSQWVLQLLPLEFESNFWRNLCQGFKEHVTMFLVLLAQVASKTELQANERCLLVAP